MVDVLVLGEIRDEVMDAVTGELLGAAREIGDEVGVALMGQSPADGAAAVALGADYVFQVVDPLLDGVSTDAAVAAFEHLCRQETPSVVLAGATSTGRVAGPRVAFRLGVGTAQDCVSIARDVGSGRIVARRPVYGGNAVATVTFPGSGPQVVMLRPGAYETPDADPGRSGQIVEVRPGLDPSVTRARHVETVTEATEGTRLEDAPVVISGGRGLGGAEPFDQLRELASVLGGAVGASRAACDAGWIDHSHQIGLTGKAVTPELYIAVGVSGASQHMAGCSGARRIVSINRDPEANIFKESAYGVVGDWNAVLPSFIEAVRELTGD
jgi:electron transfer flavoprotein alpha subunit